MNYIEETMMDASVDQPAEPTSRSRCTRSHLQEAAVWTVQDMLILVNEVAAVEGECQNALSTHQKWTIVAETCTALGVVRNANQCRRKWQSLLADYHLVKEWTSSSATDSYWSLGSESRIQAGLPSDFDKDLYKAIEDFTKAPDRTDTDPECDPEAADVDMLNAEEPAVLGPKHKKRRRRSVPHKRLIAEWKRPVLESENVKPEDLILEGMDQILAAKLAENAELINAILAENDDEDSNEDFTYLRDDEGFKIEKARRKADKLVACLGDLAKNLEHLCGRVEKG